MNNILRVNTSSIDSIKREIAKMESFLDNIDSKISQVQSVKDLNIESQSVETIKNNIIQHINNLKNLINNLTSFQNNVTETNDNLCQSLINLRNSYKRINS